MTSFNHISLYIDDLQKSSSFYEEIFQLQRIEEPFKQGKHSWFRMGDHCQLHLIEGKKTPGENLSKNWHFAFSVPDLDAFIQVLKKKNITYGDLDDSGEKIPVRPDGIRQIYFQDPDGYWIEANEDRY